MKQIFPLILGLCALIGLTERSVRACSVFTASGIDKVYAATNKDWNNFQTRIRFYAPSEGKYGRVYFGYQVAEGFQNVGGMNEHGLWYDGASLPSRSDISNHYGKPVIKGELCEKALEECATVDEVIQLYKEFYTPHWQGHSMWADRLGNSVVIEYGEDDVVFLSKEQKFQVMTNYYLSDSTNRRWSHCHRYRAITEILGNGDDLNVELMTAALDASHKEGLTPTLFSNVYDLKNGEIYVYHFHYYGEYVCFNLAEELEKGDQYLEMPDLFHRIKVVEPFQEQVVSGRDIWFHWSGAAAAYEVRYSEDKEFSEFTSAQVTQTLANESQWLGLTSLWILLFATFLKKKRRRIYLLFLPILLLGSCSACSKLFFSPAFPESLEYSVYVEDLDPGTTYYWKVVSLDESQMTSESIVRSFTTAD